MQLKYCIRMLTGIALIHKKRKKEDSQLPTTCRMSAQTQLNATNKFPFQDV